MKCPGLPRSDRCVGDVTRRAGPAALPIGNQAGRSARASSAELAQLFHPPSSDGAGGWWQTFSTARQRTQSRYLEGSSGQPSSTRRRIPGRHYVDCPPPAICERGAPVRVTGRAPTPSGLRHSRCACPHRRVPSLHCALCGRATKSPWAGLPAGVPRIQISPRALACIGTPGLALSPYPGQCVCG